MSSKLDGRLFFLWLDFAWHYLLRGACALAPWLGFFSRLRLGVALAFGRFLRDFAVRTRGREALQRSIFAVGASSAAMRRV